MLYDVCHVAPLDIFSLWLSPSHIFSLFPRWMKCSTVVVMTTRRPDSGGWIPGASQQLAVTGGWVEAVCKVEQDRSMITDRRSILVSTQVWLYIWKYTVKYPMIDHTYARMHAHTHIHTYIEIKTERHVPDKSSDLFLFWGSLGFFTGGLRFGGFSMLLGLSLSVPEFSEDKEHQLTVRYRRFRHSSTHIHKLPT